MQDSLWHQCLRHLENEVPEQQFNTWVRPLQAVERDGELQLLAPNRFVVSWIEKNLFGRIEELVSIAGNRGGSRVRLDVDDDALETMRDIARRWFEANDGQLALAMQAGELEEVENDDGDKAT